MIDLWLAAIEDLLLEAPGNDDEDAGPLWLPTLDRLGADDLEDAKENRSFYDYFEDPSDVAPARPFFVLVERDCLWQKFASDALQADGVIEVCYTERVTNVDDPTAPVTTNQEYKAARAEFVSWVGNLMESCAARRRECAVQFSRIEMEVAAARTPSTLRDVDNKDSDYFWTRWLFFLSEGNRR